MRVRLLGVWFDALTVADLHARISESISTDDRQIIGNCNAHAVYLYHHDNGMREFFRRAHTVHIDGMPLVFLSRLLGYPVGIQHRVTYADWIWPLMEESARRNWSVFYLGGRPGVAERAARKLRARYPELQMSTHHGYFDRLGDENEEVLALIRGFKPNILLVGMGMPTQERWIIENLAAIRANAILTAGACFDYVAGVVPVPARWAGRVGLEWAFRLASEPRRLWRRYLLEPWFLLRLLFRELSR